eukprot:13772028-Alexandrium_andersonii.AAC.1
MESMTGTALAAQQDVPKGMRNDLAAGSNVRLVLPGSALAIGVGISMPESPKVEGGLQGLRWGGCHR